MTLMLVAKYQITMSFHFYSFNRRVEISVVATGKLLWEVKGGGQGQAISKAEVTQAADAILQPLMDLLDGKDQNLIIQYFAKLRILKIIKLYWQHYFIKIIIFSGSLSMYAQICDKSVLKRLLKELWKIVIRSLEKQIVLPPTTNRSIDPVSF